MRCDEGRIAQKRTRVLDRNIGTRVLAMGVDSEHSVKRATCTMAVSSEQAMCVDDRVHDRDSALWHMDVLEVHGHSRLGRDSSVP